MSDPCLVVMGASLGGVRAASEVLSRLPSDLAAAIVVAQHRTADGDNGVEALLSRCCPLPVVQAEDKQPLVVGHVYVAPPGYHTLVDERCLGLDVSEPVRYARPSIDLLFQSAADAWPGGRLVGVLLTASSEDGARGLEAIAAAGGTTLVQDPATAESDVAIQCAIERACVSHVLQLSGIAEAIARGAGQVTRRVPTAAGANSSKR